VIEAKALRRPGFIARRGRRSQRGGRYNRLLVLVAQARTPRMGRCPRREVPVVDDSTGKIGNLFRDSSCLSVVS